MNFEGGSLINFGAEHVNGDSELDVGIGARYKLSEHIQFGAAVQWGLVGDRSLLDYALVFDVIFRY